MVERVLEHSGDGFVEISRILVMQDPFLFGMIAFDRIYHRTLLALPH